MAQGALLRHRRTPVSRPQVRWALDMRRAQQPSSLQPHESVSSPKLRWQEHQGCTSPGKVTTYQGENAAWLPHASHEHQMLGGHLWDLWNFCEIASCHWELQSHRCLNCGRRAAVSPSARTAIAALRSQWLCFQERKAATAILLTVFQ